jgi:two-component system, sensor histidine kinase RpfC
MPRLIVLALAAAGVLPATLLTACPGGMAMLGSPRTGIVLVTALLFAPALAGFAVALQGFDAVLARLREGSGGEHQQIVARVLLDAAIFGYILGLLAALPGDAAVLACVLIGSLNLAAAWLFLLNLILAPRRSAVRRCAAVIADVALLAVLLAAGGRLTGPLATVYLYLAVSNSNQCRPRALAGAVGLGVVAFAGVIATTPFWQEEPLMAAGMLAAMVLLPLYAGSLLHRLASARYLAEAANVAKTRLLATFAEELRGPLRAIARTGLDGDQAESDAQSIARARFSARAMLLNLDDLLNFARIDDGSLTPETRSFDIYRLSHGAIASLNPAAAERGVVLNLRVDPALPQQLRGWPHQLRHILISLVTNAIRHSANTRVRINISGYDFTADAVTVRITVASGLIDNRLETADQVAAIDDAGGSLGLALVERWVDLMGGRLMLDNDGRRGLSQVVELPFAINRTASAMTLDLAHLPVLIVSEDTQFVEELTEPLVSWRAEPRWIGAGDDALHYLEALEPPGRRAVLIVDGRYDVLLSLSWAHRAVRLGEGRMPPFVMFVADETRIDSVVGLADSELDSVLAAPFALEALRGAFHAFGVEPADQLSAAVSGAAMPAELASRDAAGEMVQTESSRRTAASSRSASDAAPANPGRRILIAASSLANRRIMSSFLTRAGHTVHLAATPDEARQGLEARAIDLLLLDLTGEQGADYEAARLYRRARPGLIIVALTKDSPEEAQRRAREIGIDAVLPKPIEPLRLVAAIESVIEDAPAKPLPLRVVGDPRPYPRSSSAVNR